MKYGFDSTINAKKSNCKESLFSRIRRLNLLDVHNDGGMNIRNNDSDLNQPTNVLFMALNAQTKKDEDDNNNN